MNISNYWYFKSALTPKFCDDVIKYGLSKSEQMAKTGGYKNKELSKEEIKDMKVIRNSDMAWLDDPCQFTKYKLNQFYDWHCDSHPKPYDHPDNKNTTGKIRKLSVTCQLTDGSEYKGGELEFDFRDYNPNIRDESNHLIKAKEILPRGSIIVFPSYVWHRVKPVKKGIRYSLVLWNLGYPYK